MVKKICNNYSCGKVFKCENECVKAGLFSKKILGERSCYCSDCAQGVKGYTEYLKHVCPRFRQSREKVNFT